MARHVAAELISFLFVLLLVYAAVSKLLDFEKFVVQIGQSPVLTGFGKPMAIVVIVTELAISVILTTKRLRLAGFLAAFGLMTAFTTYILIILNYSTFIPCSCGGILAKLGWTEHVIFNVVFMILAIAGSYLHIFRHPVATFSTPA